MRETSDSGLLKSIDFPGSDLSGYSVSVGIAGKPGVRRFLVNKHPLSSSLYPPNLDMSEMYCLFPNAMQWGENTELDYDLDIKVSTLDKLVQDKSIPMPDFLSMDIQGAEYETLLGSKFALQNSILGVISEVEFAEIYKGQGLFDDQHKLLREHNFKLAELLNNQYWYEGCPTNLGFLTVSEALFLKEVRESFSSEALFKLALIAFAFERIGLTYKCLNFIRKNDIDFFNWKWKGPDNEKYKYVFHVFFNIDSDIEKLETNPLHFLNNPPNIIRKRRFKIYRRFLRLSQILRIYAIKYTVRKWFVGD